MDEAVRGYWEDYLSQLQERLNTCIQNLQLLSNLNKEELSWMEEKEVGFTIKPVSFHISKQEILGNIAHLRGEISLVEEQLRTNT